MQSLMLITTLNHSDLGSGNNCKYQRDQTSSVRSIKAYIAKSFVENLANKQVYEVIFN